jgi:hypothetical protein
MLKALTLATIALMGAAVARAAPDSSRFDVRNAHNWAERLVLCDSTAFLATRPDFNANRMWVRRDDGHRDLLLPPDFVGAGRWYKEGYQRLYWRLRRRGEVDDASLTAAADQLGRPFIESYRRAGGYNWQGDDFLRGQDVFCRATARQQGEIIY